MRTWVTLGIVVLALWAVLWLVFKVVGWMVHLLVLVGLALLLYGLVRRGVRQTRERMR
jgi:hypothetical protein